MIFGERELAQLRRLEILAAKVRSGEVRGERETARAGPGSGFREHRSYAAGDPLRTIDWHVYARMRQLVVKVFEAEEALDVVLVQDRSASMRGAAAALAARTAAGLGAIALAQGERVVWMPAAAGRGAQTFTGRPRLAGLLECVEGPAEGPTDLLGALRANLPRTGRGGVAFLLSDFFDPRGATRAIAFLRARRYEARVILIEDLEALRAPAPGRALLVDAETGERLRVDLTPEAVAAYLRARESRAQGLRAYCRRAGAGFLRARADEPFFEVVGAAVKRGWLSL